MTCERQGCDRDVSYPEHDLCFKHKVGTLKFNGLERLRRNREDNTTQAEIKQEIFDAAKEDGVDIKKAGSTSPSSGPLV